MLEDSWWYVGCRADCGALHGRKAIQALRKLHLARVVLVAVALCTALKAETPSGGDGAEQLKNGNFFTRTGPSSADDAQILTRYLAATEQQKTALRGVSMEVDIDARMPKLKKEGKLHALRKISKLGKITYRKLGFSGDESVKNDVIARYLNAEVQAQSSGQDLSITPANYKFKFRGETTENGQKLYVFRVSPRKKKVGLFKGELWLDAETCMPIRETGRFVKSPSIFFKKLDFIREYALNDGVAVPLRVESTVDTRIVGPVQLEISFANLSKIPDADDDNETVIAAGTQ